MVMASDPNSAPSPARTRTLWLTGMALGLATGLLEVAYLVWRTQTRTSDGLGPDMPWMSPVANLLWFLPITMLLVLLRRRFSYATSTGILLGLATLSLLYLNPRLYDPAAILIALGVAVQSTRLLRKRQEGVARFAERAALPLALVVVALAVMVRVREHRREARGIAALGAPASDVNVLLLVLDTVRAMDLSLYGLDRPTTPELERWAKEGVVFNWAFATSPWTLPSHASLFTGKHAHELSTRWDKPLDGVTPTLAEALRDRGYLTAGFAANLLYVSRDWGLGRGFLHYEDHPLSAGELFVSGALGRKLQSIKGLRRLLDLHEMPGRQSAGEMHQHFFSWLDQQSAERPFFAFINYYDAHQPYLPNRAWKERFATPGLPRAHQYHYLLHEVGYSNRYKLTPGDFQREHEAYQATIGYLDEQLDRLFVGLKERGLLDKTVVIVTSDHGEHFGEHGLKGHGNSLYTQLTHVPLFVRYPALVPPGTRVKSPVSLRDIPNTVMELTGSAGAQFPGSSLSRYWSGVAQADSTPVIMSVKHENRDTYRALALGDHHLVVQTGGGDGGLFDLRADPFEERSLVTDSALPPEFAHLKARLDSLLPPLPPRQAAATQ